MHNVTFPAALIILHWLLLLFFLIHLYFLSVWKPVTLKRMKYSRRKCNTLAETYRNHIGRIYKVHYFDCILEAKCFSSQRIIFVLSRCRLICVAALCILKDCKAFSSSCILHLHNVASKAKTSIDLYSKTGKHLFLQALYHENVLLVVLGSRSKKAV